MSNNTTHMTSSATNASDSHEFTLEIPVWVHGKRKWVTGITKKTTFDDLIYALLAQADLLKPSDLTHSSSDAITGYAIAECIQLTLPSPTSNEIDPDASLLTQRIIKGRSKVIKAYKTWQFDKLPLTILQLISTSSLSETGNSSTSKLRSKIFRRFLSSKLSSSSLSSFLSPSPSDSSIPSLNHHHDEAPHQKLLHHFQENSTIIERQKRLLDYLDEKIHQAENASSNSSVTLSDVSHLFSSPPTQPEHLIFATQLCNSILTVQERLEEKTNLLNNVEQAISNELSQVLSQQHYDTLPGLSSLSLNDNHYSSMDLSTLKNSIYRSRELSRIQSKEMHDLDLTLREAEILLGSKYDELEQLEHETSSCSMESARPIPTVYQLAQPQVHQEEQQQQQQAPYDTLELLFDSTKEMDEDSGINSLTSDDTNQHSSSAMHHKLHTQLETLV